MPQKRTETAQNQKKAVPPYKDVKTGGFVGNGEKMTVTEFRDLYGNGNYPSKSKSKYNAVPKVVDQIRFASTKEANRYADLKFMENAGEITALQRQVKFKLVGCNYFADSCYFDYSTKQWITEDTKGFKTATYKTKRKQMFEVYGITILET